MCSHSVSIYVGMLTDVWSAPREACSGRIPVTIRVLYTQFSLHFTIFSLIRRTSPSVSPTHVMQHIRCTTPSVAGSDEPWVAPVDISVLKVLHGASPDDSSVDVDVRPGRWLSVDGDIPEPGPPSRPPTRRRSGFQHSPVGSRLVSR